MKITRRQMLKTSALASIMPGPALAQMQATRARTLRFVPQSNIALLDPTWTTNGVTTSFGYMVFDMLYGYDSKLQPRPQMAAGHTISDDGLTWSIRLRDGLRFHDGEPVLASDCAASIRRWGLRDSFGQMLLRAIDTMGAADDKTIRIKLKKPFPRLLEALAHPLTSICPMMPARLANADDSKPVPEIIGSGPYRFLKDEFRPGSRVAFARHEGYVPREEPGEIAAGRKRVNFDRLEWHIFSDDATAAAALQAGEVDWWGYPAPDLIPLLRRTQTVAPAQSAVSILRFNSLVPPFNNPKLRRAILEAVDQQVYMQALVGDEPGAYQTCFSPWGCLSSSIPQLGADAMKGPKSLDKARAAVAASGYAGEKVVILNPTDFPTARPLGFVTADLLKKIGMNVDFQESDWNTLQMRSTNQEPVERGGWSIFHTWKSALGMYDPTANQYMRGLGKKGYMGWYDSDKMEELFEAWLGAQSDVASAEILGNMQRLALEEAPFVVLGQWNIYTAYSKSIVDVNEVISLPSWNARRV